MILNFYKIVFIQVQWCYLIFFNKSHCLVVGIFYVSHNITNLVDFFFFEDFCWVETKGHDGNENSLDLMVILLLFFMNIICFKFQVENSTKPFLHKIWKCSKKLLWVVILTWNLVKKTHKNENHSNIWMGKFVKYHHWTLWGFKKRLVQHVE
jgi:hypothetical protein